jgi:ubiquinol oxidase
MFFKSKKKHGEKALAETVFAWHTEAMKTYYSDENFIEDSKHTTPKVTLRNDHFHYTPKTTSDRIAWAIVHIAARSADLLFKKRYGNRAIVLETIAAVPGMVGGLLQHLKALRFIRDDRGWIKALVDEAENERIHLLVYSQIAKPSIFERVLIMFVQFFFYNIYFMLYFFSPRTAHRTVGYFEEEAVHSYFTYLDLIDKGSIKNVPAPDLAKEYWHLKEHATLRDVVIATIHDEVIHRDVNHTFANDYTGTHIWK